MSCHARRQQPDGIGIRSVNKVLVIFGTRPEAIKLCPVIQCLRDRRKRFQVTVCVTAQHRNLLDQVLRAFSVNPDHDLDLMRRGQTLFQSTARILEGLEPVLRAEAPEMVLVQGDIFHLGHVALES